MKNMFEGLLDSSCYSMLPLADGYSFAEGDRAVTICSLRL